MNFSLLPFAISLVGSFIVLAALIFVMVAFGAVGGGSASAHRGRNITILVIAVAVLIVGPALISGVSAMLGSILGIALLASWLVPRVFKR